MPAFHSLACLKDTEPCFSAPHLPGLLAGLLAGWLADWMTVLVLHLFPFPLVSPPSIHSSLPPSHSLCQCVGWRGSLRIALQHWKSEKEKKTIELLGSFWLTIKTQPLPRIHLYRALHRCTRFFPTASVVPPSSPMSPLCVSHGSLSLPLPPSLPPSICPPPPMLLLLTQMIVHLAAPLLHPPPMPSPLSPSPPPYPTYPPLSFWSMLV